MRPPSAASVAAAAAASAALVCSLPTAWRSFSLPVAAQTEAHAPRGGAFEGAGGSHVDSSCSLPESVTGALASCHSVAVAFALAAAASAIKVQRRYRQGAARNRAWRVHRRSGSDNGAGADSIPVEGEDVELGGSAHMEPSEKTIEVMRKFSNQYARVSQTKFCSDKSVAAVVVVGLAHHKETLGAPLCPCRHYEDKVAEVKDGYWNCPCVPMRERKECHCMLFLQEDNPFVGDCQHLELDEILRLKNS